VSASSQDLITPNVSQIEPILSQEHTFGASVPQTPAHSASKCPGFSPLRYHQTHQSVASQDVDGQFTYPTPESMIDPDLDALYTKQNASTPEKHLTPTQALDLTQPTQPLQTACYDCNEFRQINHDCAVAKFHEQSEQAESGGHTPAASVVTQTSEESHSWKPPVCYKRGNADHIAHDCTTGIPAPKFPGIPASEPLPQSGDVENRRPIHEVPGRNKDFYSMLVAPPPASYADSEATTEDEDTVDMQPEHPLPTLAEQLIAQRNVGPNKPEPHGQPEVWADGRQELTTFLAK
jgi:hypothetical protein